LGPADCLDVFRKDLISRWALGVWRNFNLIRIFHRGRILDNQARNDLGALIAMVARIAGYGPDALEIVLINGVHHIHHAARGLLQWRVQGVLVPAVGVVRSVAMRAVQTCGRGEHTHRVHELVDGDSFKNLNVFEDFLRHRLYLSLRSLSSWNRNSEPSTHKGF